MSERNQGVPSAGADDPVRAALVMAREVAEAQIASNRKYVHPSVWNLLALPGAVDAALAALDRASAGLNETPDVEANGVRAEVGASRSPDGGEGGPASSGVNTRESESLGEGSPPRPLVSPNIGYASHGSSSEDAAAGAGGMPGINPSGEPQTAPPIAGRDTGATVLKPGAAASADGKTAGAQPKAPFYACPECGGLGEDKNAGFRCSRCKGTGERFFTQVRQITGKPMMYYAYVYEHGKGKPVRNCSERHPRDEAESCAKEMKAALLDELEASLVESTDESWREIEDDPYDVAGDDAGDDAAGETVKAAEWALNTLALAMARLEELGVPGPITDRDYDTLDRWARNTVAAFKDRPAASPRADVFVKVLFDAIHPGSPGYVPIYTGKDEDVVAWAKTVADRLAHGTTAEAQS